MHITLTTPLFGVEEGFVLYKVSIDFELECPAKAIYKSKSGTMQQCEGKQYVIYIISPDSDW